LRAELMSKLEDECQRTSLGTKFEEEVRRGVLATLGIMSATFTEGEFVGQFTLPAVRKRE